MLKKRRPDLITQLEDLHYTTLLHLNHDNICKNYLHAEKHPRLELEFHDEQNAFDGNSDE